MRQVYLFALPLLLLFAPALAHKHLRPASTDAAHTGAVEAAALAPDQAALNLIQTRIHEARRLLDAQPATPDDVVTLAVAEADRTSAPIQFLQVPKAVFLQQDAQAIVKTNAGGQLKLQIVRANYVNTAITVTDANGRAFEPLLVRYPVEKGGTLSEVAYYTSAHPALAQASLVRAGGAYVERTLESAAAQLAQQGIKIAPDVVDVAEHLAIVEHTDHKRFEHEDHAALFAEIRTLYALNAGDTFRYSVSTAGAGGMIQMIPQTYADVRAQHPEVGLEADFVTGMRDHANAAKAMLLYMQDTWDGLLKSGEVKQALAAHTATEADLLAAGYNSNPARLPAYLKRGGADWRTLIPAETKIYLRIYAAVDSTVDFS